MTLISLLHWFSRITGVDKESDDPSTLWVEFPIENERDKNSSELFRERFEKAIKSHNKEVKRLVLETGIPLISDSFPSARDIYSLLSTYHDRLRNLEALYIGVQSCSDPTRQSAIDLGRLLAQYPSLEHLAIAVEKRRSTNYHLADIAKHICLRSLGLGYLGDEGGLPMTAQFSKKLTNCIFPELENLFISTSCNHRPCNAFIKPIFDYPFSNLKHFAYHGGALNEIGGGAANDDIVGLLVDSQLSKQLESLIIISGMASEFSGHLSNEGAAILLKNAEKFTKLKNLNLVNHYITNESLLEELGTQFQLEEAMSEDLPYRLSGAGPLADAEETAFWNQQYQQSLDAQRLDNIIATRIEGEFRVAINFHQLGIRESNLNAVAFGGLFRIQGDDSCFQDGYPPLRNYQGETLEHPTWMELIIEINSLYLQAELPMYIAHIFAVEIKEPPQDDQPGILRIGIDLL